MAEALHTRRAQLPLLRQLLCRRKLDMSAAVRREFDYCLGGLPCIDHKEQVQGPAKVAIPGRPRDPLVHGDVRREDHEIIPWETALVKFVQPVTSPILIGKISPKGRPFRP